MEPKNLTPEQIEANRQAFQDAYNGNDNVIQGNFVGQRNAIAAELTVGLRVWERLSGNAVHHDNGTATLTDEDGNDWEFSITANAVTSARVLYDADEPETPEGADMDVDILNHLTAEETREVQEHWVNFVAPNVVGAEPTTVTAASGVTYLIQHDGQGNITSIRRHTGRPETNLEDQQAITQSQLYRDTLATGHQDAQAQVVRNEIGLAIQILRNLIVELRSDVTEVSAAAEGSVTSGEILNLYFRELLEYKGQLDSGKNTTEEQDRRVFFVMAVIAFYKTQRDFLKNPAQNQLPAHMRQLRRR